MTSPASPTSELAPLAFGGAAPGRLGAAYDRVAMRLAYQVRSGIFSEISQTAKDELYAWIDALIAEIREIAEGGLDWQAVRLAGDARHPTSIETAPARGYARAALAEADCQHQLVSPSGWILASNMAENYLLVDDGRRAQGSLALSEEAADLPAIAFFSCLASTTDSEGRARHDFGVHVVPIERRGVAGATPAPFELRCACSCIEESLSIVLSALRAGACDK